MKNKNEENQKKNRQEEVKSQDALENGVLGPAR